MAKITPQQMDIFTAPVVRLYRVLEQDIFLAITKRLMTSQDYSKDYVLKWQVEKMNELRLINKETIELLAKTTGVAESDIIALVKDVGIKTIKSVDEDVAKVKKITNFIPFETKLDEVMTSFVSQTFRELDNFVNQTLITTNFGTGTASKLYKNIIEDTVAKVLSGHITINEAITESVLEWRKKGLETSFIDKGGHVWTLEHYAETVLRSTVNRTYNEVRMARMEEHGAEFVLVSSHAAAREACSKIQGKVCSMKEVSSDPRYPSIYEFGYGEPDGIRGINCKHILYPFYPDININNEEQRDPEEAAERGRLVQTQRRLERSIRQAKANIEIAEAAANEELVNKYKQQLAARRSKLRDFTAEHNLPRNRQRERLR